MLEDAIKGSATFKEHPERTSTSWIMLCPKSGTSSRLEDDGSIDIEESLSIPGIKQPIDIFKIQRNESEKQGNAVYFFVGEMFTPCRVLKAMKESNIVHLSDAAIKKQLRQLKHTLQNLLKYIEGVTSNGLQVKIIHFEDRGHSALSDELIKSFESEEKIDMIEEKLLKQYKHSLPEEYMSMLSSKEE
ncbi:hypothetical protein FSP39_004205 [Pinctada imbricata]|uniref:Uncharacterized protein n=1 Tax=Pinctada imbricata TaxID=66713 RepID=A0AA88YUD9_PINIB|nr:hypothetical protein FSP39_004205 [Pinctada imbricata]